MRARSACVRKSGVVSISTLRPPVAHQHAGTQTVIARIGRRAHLAMAADGRNPHAGAGAQDGDLARGRRHQAFCAAAFATSSDTCTIAETQFGQRILQRAMLLQAEIALRLLQQHRHQVDGVPRHRQIGLVLLLFAEVHQAKLDLALGAHGKHQEEKEAGGSGKSNGSGWGCEFSVSLILPILTAEVRPVSSTRPAMLTSTDPKAQACGRNRVVIPAVPVAE